MVNGVRSNPFPLSNSAPSAGSSATFLLLLYLDPASQVFNHAANLLKHDNTLNRKHR